MDTRPVGVFDSGVGGISTLGALMRELPEERFLYFGDTANAPYGTKEKELIKVRKTINEFATVNTLDFLKKAGRVKASAAFFGNLLGVKPILIQEKNGYQTAIKKVKGRSNSLNELVSLLKEAIIDAENQTIYVVHADCNPDEVKEFEETIKRELKCKDVHISYMGPIIGASCGPETVGIWGWGKEVTYEVQ